MKLPACDLCVGFGLFAGPITKVNGVRFDVVSVEIDQVKVCAGNSWGRREDEFG